MPRKGTQSVTMYMTNEPFLQAAFEEVKRHIGDGNSGTLAQLVKDKARDIKDGKTRRRQIELLREEQSAMRAEIAELKRMIQELKHDPTDYTDHA